MKYCKKCTMPDTRPGISFDDEGVCLPCRHEEQKDSIDWQARYKELEKLCDKHRGRNGDEPDCAIAVSGGKDSHFQVHVMKEKMGMNPILFSVEDNFTMTEAGKANLRNISEEFGCSIISLKPDIRTQKLLMRKTFEEYGKPTWFIDRLIYTFPLKMALRFNTPLLVYGENVSWEFGGSDGAKETYSAKEILANGVASDISEEKLLEAGISTKDLALTIAPSKSEIESLEPIYLSYFLRWNSYEHYIFARSRGFRDLSGEWDRTMSAECFDQIDSVAYLAHAWMKYPKFGHAMATDYTARFVRYGMLSRDEAIEIIRQKDHALDPKVVEDFCAFAGYSKSEFWAIVERFYNKDLFVKDSFGRFVLKEPIWKK